MGEKIRQFFEDLLFLFRQKFFNAPKIKGKCKACGQCCRTIVFYVGENAVKTQEQFELLKKWDKKYKNFEMNGFANDGAMYFKCKALKPDGKCGVYFFRSVACRMYPKYESVFFTRGNGLKENCGYYFEKDFEDYIKYRIS